METAIGVTGFAAISIVLIGTIKPYREYQLLIGSMILVLLAMHGVSFMNVYVATLPGAESDAKQFSKYAVEMLRNGSWPDVSIGTQAYLFMLTAVYRVFGENHHVSEYMMIGQGLSIIAATANLIVIDRIASHLGVESVRWRAGVVLTTGLFPVFLLHNALTFREPFQLLGLVFGVYCVLRGIDEARVRWLFGALAGLLFMGIFHHVLLGVSFILIGSAVILVYGGRCIDRWGYSTIALLVLMIGSLGYLALTNVPATKGNDYVKEIREKGGVIEAIKDYRKEVEGERPRTSYSVPIDSSTVLATARGLAANYWLYLTAPLWRAPERMADLVPQVCSGFRLLMLGVVMWFFSFRKRAHPKILFLGLSYVVITTVWSLGTTNYGQAFRHHSLSDWLLILMVAYIVRCGRSYVPPPNRERSA